MSNIDLTLFFNFRSPYCYLASKTMFSLLDDYHVNLIWRPLAGWNGRSAPERAKVKIPLTRQDVARWAKRMNIPCNPPPITTDPTAAGVGSLLAEEQGCLREYITRVMDAEWAAGKDIGQPAVLTDLARQCGLDPVEFTQSINDPARRQILDDNWQQAQAVQVIGVPTFVIDDQIFWGNDRIDFVHEHLRALGAAK
ncbi:MAG: 2-hydroxychromene-2-carboxylate isomerase [Gammaproteobacteria bacterium]|nr:2-hydroxychromene-2-carboxylate isomerase [Gammaproteobacteria bacterium]MCY4338881.1 2-hydroxychromene-2-carboxylate isomerase [Gammaproteobacteria bacterium]